MTITRKVGKRYHKLAQKCPKCGQFHSTYAAELLDGRCAGCGTKLQKPASFLLGRNLVTVADVKANGLEAVVRYEQLYLPLNKAV